MAILLDYDFLGNAYLDDDLPSIRDIQYSEFNQSILDEINFSESKKEIINFTTYKSDNFINGQVTNLIADTKTPNLIESINGLTFINIVGVTFEMLRIAKFK